MIKPWVSQSFEALGPAHGFAHRPGRRSRSGGRAACAVVRPAQSCGGAGKGLAFSFPQNEKASEKTLSHSNLIDAKIQTNKYYGVLLAFLHRKSEPFGDFVDCFSLQKDQIRFLRVLENQKRALAEGAGTSQASSFRCLCGTKGVENTKQHLLKELETTRSFQISRLHLFLGENADENQLSNNDFG